MSEKEPEASQTKRDDGKYSPRIVVIACNWCSYAGADLAGTSRMKMPPNFRVVRVMCSGRVDVLMPLVALIRGADGVLISGCHPGDCHYISGNEHAWRRMQFLRALLAHFDFGDRVKMVHVSAGEGVRFQQIITEFTTQITALGPSPLRDKRPQLNLHSEDKRQVLIDILKYILKTTERTLGDHAEVLCEEIAEGFGEPVYDVEKCIGCGACAVNCPLDNIELRDQGAGRSINYFHSRCVGCGNCEDACPEEAIKINKHLDLVTFTRETAFQPVQLELKKCRQCNTPFVPAKQIQSALKKGGTLIADLDLELCPECRRKKIAEQARTRMLSFSNLIPLNHPSRSA
jgi:coenzyme F420-reducing hydrogenase delta subunit/formate hydrogenlyase subunit 6/NADH:ubiquinone oxidoreductase subunit I